MQILGYTKFKTDEKYRPFCNNCYNKKTGKLYRGTCCAEQKASLIYPDSDYEALGLKSPDYAF